VATVKHSCCGTQVDSSEWKYRYQQMVFGQLASYALNMKSFGMPPAKVSRLVRQLAIGNGLPSDMLDVCRGCPVHRWLCS
jgi:hypothetical protein